VANDTAVPLNRIERVLAYMIGSVGGLSVVAIVVTLLANLAGAAMSEVPWPAVAVIPFVGLPITFLLIIAFLIVSTTRRQRLGRDGS
jgi:hypothetical protein